MKKLASLFFLIMLSLPLQGVSAQEKSQDSSCTDIKGKKIAYESLQEKHISEVQEQKRLFTEFQTLRNELQSLKNQKLSDNILNEKSDQIESLKKAIQTNKQEIENKISNLPAEISTLFFESAKEIIHLTFQCTQVKVNKLQGSISMVHGLSGNQIGATVNESKNLLVQNEVATLTDLQNKIRSATEYLQEIDNRDTLKKNQEEMQGFISDMKNTIQHASKVYNYLTLPSKLSQLKNIITEIKGSPFVTNLATLEQLESQVNTMQSNTQNVSSSGSLEQTIEYFETQRIELRSIIRQLKSNIQIP